MDVPAQVPAGWVSGIATVTSYLFTCRLGGGGGNIDEYTAYMPRSLSTQRPNWRFQTSGTDQWYYQYPRYLNARWIKCL